MQIQISTRWAIYGYYRLAWCLIMITSDTTNNILNLSTKMILFMVLKSLSTHLLHVIQGSPVPTPTGALCSKTVYAHEVSIAIRQLKWLYIWDGGHAHLCHSEASMQGHGWDGLMCGILKTRRIKALSLHLSSESLRPKVWVLYSIAKCTQTLYNLPWLAKVRSFDVRIGRRCLNLPQGNLTSINYWKIPIGHYLEAITQKGCLDRLAFILKSMTHNTYFVKSIPERNQLGMGGSITVWFFLLYGTTKLQMNNPI